MKNVPTSSDMTYTLMLCEKHAKDFLYATAMDWPGGYCNHGQCLKISEFEVYLSGLANSSSYTPKGKQEDYDNENTTTYD